MEKIATLPKLLIKSFIELLYTWFDIRKDLTNCTYYLSIIPLFLYLPVDKMLRSILKKKNQGINTLIF
ncbi:MAG: hypothetical protein Q8P82_03390, partial [bacterium]|nr:hypothetical protein [bacterium]